MIDSYTLKTHRLENPRKSFLKYLSNMSKQSTFYNSTTSFKKNTDIHKSPSVKTLSNQDSLRNQRFSQETKSVPLSPYSSTNNNNNKNFSCNFTANVTLLKFDTPIASQRRLQSCTSTTQFEPKELCLSHHIINNDMKDSQDFLRALKQKLFKMMSYVPSMECKSFIKNNTVYNNKFLEYIKGDKYLNRSKKYHDKFHYHKNDLGEAHDKFNMIIDLEKYTPMEKTPYAQYQKEFTAKEKNVIEGDPTYFLKKAEDRKKLHLRIIPLTERITKEDNDRLKKMKAKAKSQEKNNDNQDNINNEYHENDVIEKRRRCYSSITGSVIGMKELSSSQKNLFDKKMSKFLKKVHRNVYKTHCDHVESKDHAPSMPKKFQKEIDDDHRQIFKKKIDTTINTNITKYLPRKEHREYLQARVLQRLRNEGKTLNRHQAHLEVLNHEKMLEESLLNMLRDNIIKTSQDLNQL